MHKLDLSEELVHGSSHSVNCNVTRINNLNGTLVLVSRSRRHNEKHIDVILGKTLCHSVAGSSQTARNVRRKLPSKHQNSHFFSSLYLFIR